MPRIRTIKPEFFTSPDTANVSHTARLLYIAMWCLADDYGRGEMNMLQLRAFAFPEEDQWLASELQRKGEEFQSLCKEVVNGFGIDVYKHRGRTFYSIPSWDEHQKTQRRANSKFPAPDNPECSPDQRFTDSEGTSESLQGNSEQTQGNVPLGTGKGNMEREHRNIYMSEASSDMPARKPNTYPDAFEEWWRAYPRHKNASKKKSLDAWRKALKVIDESRLLELTRVYAANPGVEEVRLIPHPTTWLNEQRWESIDDADIQPPTQPRKKTGWDFGRYADDQPPIIDAEVYDMRGIAQ